MGKGAKNRAARRTASEKNGKMDPSPREFLFSQFALPPLSERFRLPRIKYTLESRNYAILPFREIRISFILVLGVHRTQQRFRQFPRRHCSQKNSITVYFKNSYAGMNSNESTVGLINKMDLTTIFLLSTITTS